ncbi:hypothetical protein [Streptacidiphilus jiangxiensis]|uniref:Uncharacterized protein n=1 Tax=Streptacidiphilus jiangxiensis TaxID=235985 RepID=A0A1H7NVD6_STRJI|nr:hypothetical protein [Streptacidiphilus jiangxiensis]SEL27471.1 hypothetical protein SAMN05414137_10792 [Streptacidiphilus jiangxiensis]
MTIELVCLTDGEVLVPALTLTSLLREVSDEMSGWTAGEGDPRTVSAVKDMLDSLADRIDVDCIAVSTEAAAHVEGP